MNETERLQDQISRAIADGWQDEKFRERLLADPTAALASAGLSLPEGLVVNVMEKDGPARAESMGSGELTDAELAAASGGATYHINFENSIPQSGITLFQKNPNPISEAALAWTTLPKPAWNSSFSSFEFTFTLPST